MESRSHTPSPSRGALLGLAYARAIETRGRAEALFLPKRFTTEASLTLDGVLDMEEALEAAFLHYAEAA